MIETLLSVGLLSAVLPGIGWGVLLAATVRFLDFCLDYGHVLGRLRLRAAKRAAVKLGELERFEQQATEYRTLLFPDRVAAFDELYWQVASRSPGLVPWLCVTCMTGRGSVLLGAILLIAYGLSGTTLLMIWIMTMAAFVAQRRL